MEAIKKAKATKKNGKGDSDDDDDDDAEVDEDDDDEEDEEEEVKPVKKTVVAKRKKADTSDESAGSDDVCNCKYIFNKIQFTMYILSRMMATKTTVTTVPRRVLYLKRRLQLNVGVKRRMTATVMKTGKVPKKARKEAEAYVLCGKHMTYMKL